MSGGLFDYSNDTLCDEVTGVYPQYDLKDEKTRALAKAARILNKLYDKDISELTYDLFCLLHSFDWHMCGDTGREDYQKDVKAFKEKWLKNEASDKVSYFERRIE